MERYKLDELQRLNNQIGRPNVDQSARTARPLATAAATTSTVLLTICGACHILIGSFTVFVGAVLNDYCVLVLYVGLVFYLLGLFIVVFSLRPTFKATHLVLLVTCVCNLAGCLLIISREYCAGTELMSQEDYNLFLWTTILGTVEILITVLSTYLIFNIVREDGLPCCPRKPGLV